MKAPSSLLFQRRYLVRNCILLISLFATACEIRNEPRTRSPSHSIKEPAGSERTERIEKQSNSAQAPQRLDDQTGKNSVDEEPAEIAIMLSPDLPLDEVPAVMEQAAKDLARRFPGIDLTVVGYAPADPPMPVGRADFNSQTGETSFKWEMPNAQPKVDDNLIQI